MGQVRKRHLIAVNTSEGGSVLAGIHSSVSYSETFIPIIPVQKLSIML